jgi:hypothetical protein
MAHVNTIAAAKWRIEEIESDIEGECETATMLAILIAAAEGHTRCVRGGRADPPGVSGFGFRVSGFEKYIPYVKSINVF